tara:strand:- start:1667 stop:2041 length:375 start_codon:yes stop_codon:yes gene_type:complete
LYKKALNLIKWQTILGMAPVILYFFYAGAAAGFAALYGLLITLVANVIVAFFLFRQQGALAAGKIIRFFYLGEALKIIATILMFLLAVTVFKFSFLPLIISFIFSQIIWYFCPLLANKRIKTTV